jgi:hypothetical protein
MAGNVGDTVLQVMDTNNFQIGNGIKISAGTAREEKHEITALGSITIGRPLEYTQPFGAPVVVFSGYFVYAGGDPIVRIGGNKTKFWMKNHEPTPLIQTPYMHLFGSTFPGFKPDLQWFGTFWVTVPDGREMFRVSIKRDLHLQNTSACFGGNCASLEMKVFGKTVSFVDLPERGRDFLLKHIPDVQFRIGRSSHEPPRVFERTFEYVWLQTPDLVFMISPAHAAVDFPRRPLMALKYAHLDLFVSEMHKPERFGGILPQLWGVSPMSPEVEAMLVEPDWSSVNSSASACRRASSPGEDGGAPDLWCPDRQPARGSNRGHKRSSRSLSF